MMFRVSWTETSERESKRRDYFTSNANDAWDLWHWITTRSTMDGEYHTREVVSGQASRLFAPLYVSPTVEVRVFDEEGHELDPKGGLEGMYRYKVVTS